MSTKLPKQSHRETCQGFTLIELIVVIAGLGMLSSLAIPNYLKYLDYAKVDQAKSMLNAAAADCLQGLRNEGTTRLSKDVDPTILSNDLLASIDYQFNSGLNTCGNTLIQRTTNPSVKVLPQLGFSVNASGKVFKQAVDEGGETTSPAKSWAGSNTSSIEGLEEFLEYNALITTAQATCTEDLNAWLTSIGDGKTYSWNSAATSGCPSNPPKVESATCTTNGCNAPYYALDGKKVGTTADSYDAALAAKYGKICTEKTKAKRDSSPPYTNPNSASITITECGAKQFWFFEGEDVGSQVAWEKLYHKANNPTGIQTLSDGSELYLCLGDEYKTKDLMDQCISSNEKAACENLITNRIASKENGYFKAQDSGPIPCTSEYWFCDGSDKESEAGYNESACGKKDCGPPPLGACTREQYYGADFCIAWTTCEGLYRP